MTANKKMKLLLESPINDTSKIIFGAEKMEKLFFPNFVSVYDCIYISDSSRQVVSEEAFNSFIREKYTDKTGFEGSINDTLVNFYLNNSEELAVEVILKVALTVLRVWAKSLKAMESKSRFCLIVSCDCENNFVVIRFHKVRDGERLWIGDNIESFNQPVGYMIV
jgi:hypothetical protein